MLVVATTINGSYVANKLLLAQTVQMKQTSFHGTTPYLTGGKSASEWPSWCPFHTETITPTPLHNPANPQIQFTNLMLLYCLKPMFTHQNGA